MLHLLCNVFFKKLKIWLNCAYIQAEFTSLSETRIVDDFGRVQLNAFVLLVILQVPGLVFIILTPCRPSRAFLFDLQNIMWVPFRFVQANFLPNKLSEFKINHTLRKVFMYSVKRPFVGSPYWEVSSQW